MPDQNKPNILEEEPERSAAERSPEGNEAADEAADEPGAENEAADEWLSLDESSSEPPEEPPTPEPAHHQLSELVWMYFTSPLGISLSLVNALLLVALLVGLFFPEQGAVGSFMLAFIFLGLLLAAGAHLLLVAELIMEDPAIGFISLLFPPLVYKFIGPYWRQARVAIMTAIGGAVLACIGVFLLLINPGTDLGSSISFVDSVIEGTKRDEPIPFFFSSMLD